MQCCFLCSATLISMHVVAVTPCQLSPWAVGPLGGGPPLGRRAVPWVGPPGGGPPLRAASLGGGPPHVSAGRRGATCWASAAAHRTNGSPHNYHASTHGLHVELQLAKSNVIPNHPCILTWTSMLQQPPMSHLHTSIASTWTSVLQHLLSSCVSSPHRHQADPSR